MRDVVSSSALFRWPLCSTDVHLRCRPFFAPGPIGKVKAYSATAMKKMSIVSAIGLVLLGWAGTLPAAQTSLQADAQAAVARFKRTDPTLSRFFESAVGYVVFPSVGKGGFIVGGAHGNGVVYKHGQIIGTAELTQGTIGAQIGGQVFSEIIFFETQEALNDFKESKLQISAQIGAVAAAEGVAKNAKYTQGVAIFTLPKAGLMAEASVGGQKFDYKPLPKPEQE